MNNRESKINELINETESYSDDSLFNITSFGVDMSFREIISMYQEGDLEKPEMQRKYVWTRKEASRFIDSLLLGLPVPSIFLAKTKDEKRLIVDGYQRIMTVNDYINGIFSGDGKPFNLTKSGIINQRWRGKVFNELNEDEKRRIRYSTIHAIVFEQKQPENDSGMYQIFERINTSGRVLKAQEIRNCVYRGKFNRLLIELNEDRTWRLVLGMLEQDSRMLDVELILRAFAFIDFESQMRVTQKQINLVRYLNDYMLKNSEISDEKVKEYREKFIEIASFLYNSIGDVVFKNGRVKDGSIVFSNNINPAILDSVFAATDYIRRNKGLNSQTKVQLFQNYSSLVMNDDYQAAITTRTTDVTSIKTRIELAIEILFGVKYEWSLR